jgi:hypothetical protein
VNLIQFDEIKLKNNHIFITSIHPLIKIIMPILETNFIIVIASISVFHIKIQIKTVVKRNINILKSAITFVS